MYCRECGTELDSSASYCTECGAAVSDEESDSSETEFSRRRDTITTIKQTTSNPTDSRPQRVEQQSGADNSEQRSTPHGETESVKVWYPDPGIIQLPLEVVLVFLLWVNIASAVEGSTGGSIGSGTIVGAVFLIVLLYAGQALFRVYSNLIQPNPRQFDDVDEFLAFVHDRSDVDPSYTLSGIFFGVGFILMAVGWGNFVNGIASFFGLVTVGVAQSGGSILGTIVWFIVVGIGIRLFTMGCDGLVLTYVQRHKVKQITSSPN